MRFSLSLEFKAYETTKAAIKVKMIIGLSSNLTTSLTNTLEDKPPIVPRDRITGKESKPRLLAFKEKKWFTVTVPLQKNPSPCFAWFSLTESPCFFCFALRGSAYLFLMRIKLLVVYRECVFFKKNPSKISIRLLRPPPPPKQPQLGRALLRL